MYLPTGMSNIKIKIYPQKLTHNFMEIRMSAFQQNSEGKLHLKLKNRNAFFKTSLSLCNYVFAMYSL
jgi:hypothetical protein